MEAPSDVLVFVSGGIVGWMMAPRLVALGNHLLAGVAAEEASPTTLGGATERLPLALAGRWPLALRLAVTAGVALAVGRALAMPVPHVLWAAGALAVCAALLALIAVLDGATHLIFGALLVPLVVMAVIGGAFAGPGAWMAMILGGAVLGGVTLALYWVGRGIYGTDALGSGDVQLAAVVGLLLGWPMALGAMLWSCLAMGTTALALLALRRATAQSYLPLGTFIALGALVALCLRVPPWL